MKISELIAVLENRRQKHGDVDVIVIWEGTIHTIEPRDVYLAEHEGMLLDYRIEKALFIDADGCFSKDVDAVDPTEGDDGT